MSLFVSYIYIDHICYWRFQLIMKRCISKQKTAPRSGRFVPFLLLIFLVLSLTLNIGLGFSFQSQVYASSALGALIVPDNESGSSTSSYSSSSNAGIGAGAESAPIKTTALESSIDQIIDPAIYKTNPIYFDKTVNGNAAAAAAMKDIKSWRYGLYIRNGQNSDSLILSLIRNVKVGSYPSSYWGHYAVQIKNNYYRVKGTKDYILRVDPGIFFNGSESYYQSESRKLIKKLNLRSGSTVSKVYRLFTYIKENITYNLADAANEQTPYTLFRYKRSVCAGASGAFCYILNMVGVRCIPITVPWLEHEICMVKINNSWFVCDPTPTNPKGTPSLAEYFAYFLTDINTYRILNGKDFRAKASYFTSSEFNKYFPISTKRYKLSGSVPIPSKYAGYYFCFYKDTSYGFRLTNAPDHTPGTILYMEKF